MLTGYCELLAVMHFPLFFVCFTVKNDSFCCLVVVLSHGVFLATVVISTSAFDKREILNRKHHVLESKVDRADPPPPSIPHTQVETLGLYSFFIKISFYDIL